MIEKKVASPRKQGIWRVKKGFTLVEMLVVLLVISILVLLFVPKLANQRGIIDEKGNAAIVKVVETQIELFRLNEDRVPSKEELIAEGYVSEEQYAIYEQRK